MGGGEELRRRARMQSGLDSMHTYIEVGLAFQKMRSECVPWRQARLDEYDQREGLDAPGEAP